jgi:TPR repeat protein
MKLMFISILVFVLNYQHVTAFSTDSKCNQLDWTQEDSRTQGGGWIWFPGKGVGTTIEDAYLKAEGLAIGRLIQECGVPHKEVKIHERCDEKNDLEYMAYIRVSILESKCVEIKYANEEKKKVLLNRELMKIFHKYQARIEESKNQNTSSKTIICTVEMNKRCLDRGRVEYSLGNHEIALQYYDEVCKNGELDGCFNAGLASWMLKNQDQALRYFNLPCKQNDATACYLKGRLLKLSGRPLEDIEAIFKKACDLKKGEACYEQALVNESQNKMMLAAINYEKSCNLNVTDGCHQGSAFFFTQGDLNRAEKLSEQGCKNNFNKSCFNHGLVLQKIGSKDYLKSFEKACILGLGQGCEKSGDIHKGQKSETALTFFNKGCELGNKEACHKGALSFLDKKDIKSFTRYSKDACALGHFKACYNLGILEKKTGNMKEAEALFSHACKNGLMESCEKQ